MDKNDALNDKITMLQMENNQLKAKAKALKDLKDAADKRTKAKGKGIAQLVQELDTLKACIKDLEGEVAVFASLSRVKMEGKSTKGKKESKVKKESEVKEEVKKEKKVRSFVKCNCY